MSRGSSMSGSNNIPLGPRTGSRDGALAQAAASLSGQSLLNPEYLQTGGATQHSSGGISKFGPIASVNIGPPKVITSPNGSGGFGMSSQNMGGGFGGGGERKKLPNMELIASINATLAKKSGDAPPSLPPGGFGSGANSAFSGPPEIDDAAGRKKKRKSRWGTEDVTERLFIPGMPTTLPGNLSKEQEEAYILQLKIEDISQRLRHGDLGIPANPEERSPSPEPIYSNDGKRMNTREYRKRKELEEMRHDAVQKMMLINPDFKPPTDYRPPMIKVHDKVMIPQDEHPEINFVGLLIGPRGNTLKAMEQDTGAKIIIRGKGSVKEGKVGLRNGHPLPGEDEPLHAYVTATNLEAVRKAVERIKDVIKEGVDIPEGQNDLRKNQLRELAQLNGTLREGEVPRCTNCGASDHKSWQCQDKPNYTNSVICSACGGVGHIAKDCVMKRPGYGGFDHNGPRPNKQTKIDEEYMSLMAELGEGPPPPANKEGSSDGGRPAWQQGRSGGQGMFNNRQGAPRPLMGPGGQGRGDGPPRGGDREYNGERSGGWGNNTAYPPRGGHGGDKPPSLMHQNYNSSWNDNRRGSGWKPPHSGGPSSRGGSWNPPPPPPQSGGKGGGPAYGLPPPYFNAPPPPPPGGPSDGSQQSWGWGAGPVPVPPPPPPGTGRGGHPPAGPSYWGGGHGGWQQGPPPPPGTGPAPGLNLSTLIAAPPPPPPN